MFSLKGKAAIVTGGANGIGKGIAKALLQAGASVLITDFDAKEGQKATEELSKFGRIAFFYCDVVDRRQVDAAVAFCAKKFGSVDILVNNAGIYPFAPFMQMTPEQWQKVLDVNLNGVFHFSQAAAARMIAQKRGGKIVNIASIAGIKAFPALVHYCTSKGGVIAFTRTLADELAPNKINVNGIGPGLIETPGTKAITSNKKQLAEMVAKVPWRRPGVPQDIAYAVVYLASTEADYMTGQTIFVDGGWTI